MNTPASEQEWPEVGSLVEKTGGDYTFRGVIVSGFKKKSGVVRYVVENDDGMLFIFNASQLKPLRPPAGVDADHDHSELFKIAVVVSGDQPTADEIAKRVIEAGFSRSHHTAVTAAGVDTVGHTDVRVEELAQFIANVMCKWAPGDADIPVNHEETEEAQALLDQFNVTRKAKV